MSTAMYFLEQTLFRRENNQYSKIRIYENSNYISKTTRMGRYELLAGVNQVLTNKNATYMVMVQSDEENAILTLSVDAQSLDFRHFTSMIVSGTSISIQSSVNTTAEITLVEVES